MRCAIELNSRQEVEKFNEAVSALPYEVMLTGKDEHGSPWKISAKSLMASLVVSAKMQTDREHTAHDVDWNTIYVDCDHDIYSSIQEFAKGSVLDT